MRSDSNGAGIQVKPTGSQAGTTPVTVDVNKVKYATRLLLEAIGENPEREGIKGTPDRVARFWQSFVEYAPGKTETTFAQDVSSQMVIVSGMRVYSLCEHHLMPFWCDISVAYIPNGRVLGLSKFARIAHQYAHSLQLQERLVTQIADRIEEIAGVPDVAVLAQGEHFCMLMRGIKTRGLMTSTVMRGAFMDNDATRKEFLDIAKR